MPRLSTESVTPRILANLHRDTALAHLMSMWLEVDDAGRPTGASHNTMVLREPRH